jgi:hypothetical protein
MCWFEELFLYDINVKIIFYIFMIVLCLNCLLNSLVISKT